MKQMRAEFSVRTDIPYLGEKRSERMDAYLPSQSGEKSAPAVVLVHGGEWTDGSRKGEREVDFAEALARSGFAVFSIDYALGAWSGPPFKSRLVRSAWPQCIYDCKSAIRYVRHNAADFGVNPMRIAVAGGSAGGHIAMMTALTGQRLAWNQVGPFTGESSAVDCVVVSRGIFNVDNQFSKWLIDESDANDPLVQKAASPLSHIERGAPPVLAFHGSKDGVVDIGQAQTFTERLARFGIEHRLVVVEEKGHDFRLDEESCNLMFIVETFLRWNLLCR
jgi:acetyl esterase/lipase